MAALCGRLAELGYGWAFRVLDARHFGVPQRRRRVFIVGLRSGPDDPDGHLAAERAAAVLAVGTRCARHPATGHETGPGAAGAPQLGVDVARAVTGTSWKRHDDDTDTLIASGLQSSLGHHGHSSPRGDGGDNLVVGSPPDSGGVRASDGLARRLDDRGGVVNSLDTKRGGADDNEAQAGHLVPFIVQSLDTKRPAVSQPVRTNPYNNSDPGMEAGMHLMGNFAVADDPLLPLGLDSHRYRCCGNGVVAPVAEWLGWRLRSFVQELDQTI